MKKQIDVKNDDLKSIKISLMSVNCTCPFCHKNTLHLVDSGRVFYCLNCRKGFNAWIYLLTGKIEHGLQFWKIIKILLRILYKNRFIPFLTVNVLKIKKNKKKSKKTQKDKKRLDNEIQLVVF